MDRLRGGRADTPPAAPAAAAPSLSKPLVLRAAQPLVVPGRWWLAPMEGVTDPVFREFVIARGGVGAACTEFVRLTHHPLPVRTLRRQLGPVRGPCPLALQIMAAGSEHLAASVEAARRAGARWIDLNFGCPAPGVFRKCAGSALLEHPERIGEIVATAVRASPLPVTAKIRAGVHSAARLREIVDAIADAGAAAIVLHARLRTDRYTDPPHWAWIAEAKQQLVRRGATIPLVGNGGIETVADGERMRAETGCDAVMVGRGAIADPFLFRQAAGGPAASRQEAADFALRYADAVRQRHGERAALARLKQLLRYYRAGDLVPDASTRRSLLRTASLSTLLSWLRERGREGDLASRVDAEHAR
ncbi:MAG: tRNA-dihydrouridine synthase family protein [Planctomycetota bacterium]|nr:MAG: tRNA-dihydrouridine synthase family protein [Planctomycetota bacterium]